MRKRGLRRRWTIAVALVGIAVVAVPTWVGWGYWQHHRIVAPIDAVGGSRSKTAQIPGGGPHSIGIDTATCGPLTVDQILGVLKAQARNPSLEDVGLDGQALSVEIVEALRQTTVRQITIRDSTFDEGVTSALLAASGLRIYCDPVTAERLRAAAQFEQSEAKVIEISW